MSVLLLSTYDLGRQPFGLASPAAFLRHAGLEVVVRDLSRERVDDTDIRQASLIALYLPMHTATRLALPVIDRLRAVNPSALVCAYGLYAPLSATLLRERGVAVVLGPEAEQQLVTLARDRHATLSTEALPKLAFLVPDRSALPPIARYATLRSPDGSRRLAGSTEATRGCKHRCRHCPIVPVYDGQFRVVPVEIVLADITQQVAQGATHITFGDPDFFNGPAHARRIIDGLHARHPGVTYDVTIKIEHLLKHQDLLPRLAATGCAFVTSAVESVDDEILVKLDKGHTRADFVRASDLCRTAGLVLSPTFVAFTPWTTLEGYQDLLDTVSALGLVDHVAPVQWGLRLLVTYGSRLLEIDDLRAQVGNFDRVSLTYPWVHGDPRVDALQAGIMRMVGSRLDRPRHEVFDAVSGLTGIAVSGPVDTALDEVTTRPVAIPRTAIPYLDEPWYC